jgi:hypothetical protein
MSSRRTHIAVSPLLSPIAAALLAVAAPTPAAAQKLCAPLNTWTGAPNVDGTIANDLGWAGAGRYVFANGTARYDGAVDLIRDGTNLYLGFEMHNDDVTSGHAVDQFDAVAVAFDVPGASPEYRLIVIQPRVPTGGNLNPPDSGPVSTLQFATAGAVANPTTDHVTWTTIATPAGAAAKFTSGGTGTDGSWYVELQVPIAALSLPATGDFGLYVDGMRADAVNPGLAALVWPPAAPAIGSSNPAAHLLDGSAYPTPSNWGKSTLGGSGCTGVYFAGGFDYDPTDVYVNNPGNALISASGTNQFFAKLHNNGPQAPGVVARFKLSGTGIAGAWDDVPGTPANGFGPVTVNTDPAVTLTQSGTIAATDWTGGTAQYKGTHVCMLVELDMAPSAGTQVNFLNRSAIQNMDWSTTSTFRAKPVIDAAGWKPLPGESAIHLGLHTVSRAAPGWSNGLTGVERGKAVAQIEWAVHGYLGTGQFLTIGGKSFRVEKPVGGFEYVLHHALAVNVAPPVERAPANAPNAAATDVGSRAFSRIPPLLAGRVIDPGLIPVSSTEGLPAVKPTDWSLALGGATPQREDPTRYVLDLQPGQKVELSTVADYPPRQPCGCPRIPGTAGVLVVVGLLSLRRTARRT